MVKFEDGRMNTLWVAKYSAYCRMTKPRVMDGRDPQHQLTTGAKNPAIGEVVHAVR